MKKPHWIFLVMAAALTAGWLGYALAGRALAGMAAEHFGNALMRLGQGKFRDPGWFVQYRLAEALWLATVALLLAFVFWWFNGWLKRKFSSAGWRGVAGGVFGFVALNLWVGAALNTALFWAVLGMGGGVQNLMQFHFKRILLEENRTPVRAVLMGNSQTRAEIKEEILNEQLGTNFWATELHFPGSHGYDVLLLEDEIRRANPDLVICYVTEGYFYNGSYGGAAADFLGWSDLPELRRLGGQHYVPWNGIFSGLFGDICPIFRCRQVLAQRLFGSATAQLKQVEYDAALNPNLNQRAREKQSDMRLGAESAFQQRAFEVFVAHCESTGRRVVLLEGGFNPLYEQQIDPAIRQDMHRYLAGLQARHANVILIPASALPRQTPEDYVDLDHVNEAMQQRFSIRLAALLKPLIENHPSPAQLPGGAN